MSTIQVQALLSPDELLRAVGQLSLTELEQFAQEVLALRAQREAPALPRVEGELLLKINQGIPAALQQRYSELVSKRQAGALTPVEHSELLRLSDEVEKLEATRAECLAELARLRRTSLSALMQDLGIRPPTYA